MLTKITVAEREGTTAKTGLFWHKTINQISHPPWLCPTLFNIENLTCIRLAYHYRPRFMALSHNAERVAFALHEKPNVEVRGAPLAKAKRSRRTLIKTELQNCQRAARPFNRLVRLLLGNIRYIEL